MGTHRLVPVLAVAALVAPAGGCEKSDRVAVHPARGQVTVNGKPAAGARVFFHSAANPADPKGLHPFAVVGPDGSFRLTTYLLNDGAPAGDYVVTVTWPVKSGADEEPAGDRLNGRYADPRKSDLRATVTPGDNVLDPIHLK